VRGLIFFFLLTSCGDFAPAAHTPLPQLDGHERVVLAAPQIVTITFPGYAHTAEVEAFGDFIGGSAWLRAVGADYGVGAATHAAQIVWPAPAPDGLTDQGLRALIAQGITDGTLPAPPASGNAYVYLFYWPSNVVLDASSAGAGVLCQRGAFHSAGGAYTAGFHESAPAPGGGRVPYAVVGDCDGSIERITLIASRELIGCASNPYEIDVSGWLLDVASDDPWLMNLDNGEAGYLCTREPPVKEGAYVLHRAWSNREAQAGRQPCIPADDTPYVNVSAAPDRIVSAAAGSQVSYQLTGWSTAAADPWELQIEKPDGSDFVLDELQPTLSRGSLANGEQLTLTLSVPATAHSAQYGGIDVVSNGHVWPVAFTVR
jgi:hypothetical protein